MREVSQTEAIRTLPVLLEEAKVHALIIKDGESGSDLGALISMEDFELVRRAKVDKLLASMAALGKELRTNAAEHGLSPHELESMLDRHNL